MNGDTFVTTISQLLKQMLLVDQFTEVIIKQKTYTLNKIVRD